MLKEFAVTLRLVIDTTETENPTMWQWHEVLDMAANEQASLVDVEDLGEYIDTDPPDIEDEGFDLQEALAGNEEEEG